MTNVYYEPRTKTTIVGQQTFSTAGLIHETDTEAPAPDPEPESDDE